MARMRKGDWVGRFVKLRTEIVTHNGVRFPRGEVMLVTRNYAGLTLQTTKVCDHCKRGTGGDPRITKLPERCVELLPADFKP